jgi:hypothetical protein
MDRYQRLLMMKALHDAGGFRKYQDWIRGEVEAGIGRLEKRAEDPVSREDFAGLMKANYPHLDLGDGTIPGDRNFTSKEINALECPLDFAGLGYSPFLEFEDVIKMLSFSDYVRGASDYIIKQKKDRAVASSK